MKSWLKGKESTKILYKNEIKILLETCVNVIVADNCLIVYEQNLHYDNTA